MNLKQRLSLISAAALPVLALFAYFLIAPARANAQSCPGGMVHTSCAPGFCNDGHSGCTVRQGQRSIFVFCPPFSGPGICEAGGWVCCTQ